jgi:hypothetical protein
VEIQRRIVEVDPLSIIGRLNYSPVLAFSNLEAGREMAHGTIDQSPWAGYTALGQIDLWAGKDLSGSLGWFMHAYGEDPHDELSNRYLIGILAMVGEYDEARRISDGNLYLADIQQNRLESAIHALEITHAGDPENSAPTTDLADALHLAGRFEESQRLYASLQARSPSGVIFDTRDTSTRPTLRMAFAYKLASDDAAAAHAIEIHRKDLQSAGRLACSTPQITWPRPWPLPSKAIPPPALQQSVAPSITVFATMPFSVNPRCSRWPNTPNSLP